ncbi:MAG: DUF2085 domain-containing protein [Acidobacteriota bacterium]
MFEQRSTGAVWVYAATLSSGLLMLALIVGAPLLSAHGHPIVGAIVYQAFVPLCHQIPERSFHLGGLPLAVCARCAGVYGGFVLALLIYPLWRSLDNEQTPGRIWLLIALLPMAIDALAGAAGLVETTFFSRTATGALAGAAVAFYILPGLVSIVRSRRASSDRRSSA